MYECSKSSPVLATLNEAAKLLRLSPRKVWQMGKDGSIRTERFGRSVRYRVSELLDAKGNDHGKA
jgi:excisionase family DNA binding protein